MASTWMSIWSVTLLSLQTFLLPFYILKSIWDCLFKGRWNTWEKKIVMVTGAGNGLGREMARQLAKKNALVLCVDMKKDDLEETIQIIEQETEKKGIARPYVCDITDVAKINEMRDSVLSEFGKLDVLINNAAFLYLSPIEKGSEDLIRRCIDVNLLGTTWMTRAFLPSMKSINSGQIVYISSLGAISSEYGFTAYCMTKAAVSSLASSLHQEVNSRSEWSNIKISAAHPWFIDSNPLYRSAYRCNLPAVPLKFCAESALEGARRGTLEFLIPCGAFGMRFLLFFSRILPSSYMLLSKRILDVQIGQVPENLMPEYWKFSSPEHSHKMLSNFLTKDTVLYDKKY